MSSVKSQIHYDMARNTSTYIPVEVQAHSNAAHFQEASEAWHKTNIGGTLYQKCGCDGYELTVAWEWMGHDVPGYRPGPGHMYCKPKNPKPWGDIHEIQCRRPTLPPGTEWQGRCPDPLKIGQFCVAEVREGFVKIKGNGKTTTCGKTSKGKWYNQKTIKKMIERPTDVNQNDGHFMLLETGDGKKTTPEAGRAGDAGEVKDGAELLVNDDRGAAAWGEDTPRGFENPFDSKTHARFDDLDFLHQNVRVHLPGHELPARKVPPREQLASFDLSFAQLRGAFGGADDDLFDGLDGDSVEGDSADIFAHDFAARDSAAKMLKWWGAKKMVRGIDSPSPTSSLEQLHDRSAQDSEHDSAEDSDFVDEAMLAGENSFFERSESDEEPLESGREGDSDERPFDHDWDFDDYDQIENKEWVRAHGVRGEFPADTARPPSRVTGLLERDRPSTSFPTSKEDNPLPDDLEYVDNGLDDDLSDKQEGQHFAAQTPEASLLEDEENDKQDSRFGHAGAVAPAANVPSPGTAGTGPAGEAPAKPTSFGAGEQTSSWAKQSAATFAASNALAAATAAVGLPPPDDFSSKNFWPKKYIDEVECYFSVFGKVESVTYDAHDLKVDPPGINNCMIFKVPIALSNW